MSTYSLNHLVHIENPSQSSEGDERNDYNSSTLDRSPSNADLDSMPLGEGAVYTGPQQSLQTEHDERKRSQEGRNASSEYVAVTKPQPTYTRPLSWLWPDEIPTPTTIEPTPNELETSRPSSPTGVEVTEAVQSWRDPAINKWRLLSACLYLFGNGMNDSAPGALLPYMEEYYHIGYAIVSMIFIANAVGFILAAFFISTLDNKLKRAKTLMLSDVICLVAYLIMALAPPFPLFAIGFFIAGLAQAINLALNNVFVANLANATVLLGWFHGSYGVGGTISPIIATSLVNNGTLFARFYFIMFGIRFASLFLGGWSFWNFEKDIRTSAATHADNLQLNPLPKANIQQNQTISAAQGHEQLQDRPVKAKPHYLKASLMNRTTLFGALFIFAYQGAEVSISGWVISFLISYRDGNPSQVGYVTAGFWAGITIGRFVLSYAAPRIGEKLFTYILTVGALLVQLIVWFVPNVVGNAVAIAFLGLLLGPIYPCGTTVFMRLLPRPLQHTAVAFISGAGSSGGALAPFMTGLLAQAAGTWVLHPVCVALFVVMMVTWGCLPRVTKKREE